VGAKSIDTIDAVIGRHYGDWSPASAGMTEGETAPESAAEHQNIYRSPQTAYVTVMRGCSLNCSYCIVPSVRGPAVCLTPAAILEDAAARLKAGAKELVLLGQTVNSYKYGRLTFTGLLKQVLALPGLQRLRVMSPHPLYFDDEFTALLAGEEKLARHIHLPVQSGSDRILKLMRRGYTGGQYLALLARLRAAAPDLAVSTDFIVGYPGETEKDFAGTLALIKEGGFSQAYCFKYSPRTDGPEMAATLGKAGLEARLEKLLAAVRTNSRVILNKRIGKIEEVLFETATYGRTSGNFALRVKAGGAPGRVARVAVGGAEKNTLNGKVLL